MTTPLDLMHVFCTPSMGVGQRLKIETIDKRLAQLPVRLVLEVLGQACCHSDQGIKDREREITFAGNFFPAPFLPRMREILRTQPNVVPMSSQVLANLAVRALVVCPDVDYSNGDVEGVAREVGALALGLADHVMEGAQNEQDLTLAIARMSIYFRLNDLSSWYEVARRLLFEVLPSLSNHPDYFDADYVCHQAYGLDIELLWALTVGFGVAAKTNADYYLLPQPLTGGVIDDETLRRWAEVWSIDLAAARILAAEDLRTGNWWSFRAIFDKPTVKINDTHGVAVRPAFLAQKATPAGMFWVVRNAWVDQGGDHQQWARLFGAGVEQLGRALISELAPGVPHLPDDEAVRHRWGDGKVCDFVMLGDRWVAIDFVHRQLTKATSATGDFTDLARDVRLAALDKLEQIDEALARGLDVEPEPASIVPLVVVGAPFPSSPLVMRYIEAQLGSRKVIGRHPACRPPVVMDLSEFHVLLQVASAHSAEPVAILEQWLDSDLGRDSFRSWLTTDGPGRHLPGGGAISDGWGDVVRRRLFGAGAVT